MHLYSLDEADASLTLVPMAARRALDRAGKRLSLKGWQALPLGVKQELTALGSVPEVDGVTVQQCLENSGAEVEQISVEADPPSDEPPAQVLAAFGAERPIPGATWSALSSLDRFVLCKIAKKARPARLDLAYREIVGDSSLSTHLAPQGGVRMVDVGAKQQTERTATAVSRVAMNTEAFSRLLKNNPKGDVLGTARLAGIMAAKRTSELIPLCHPIAVTKVEVTLVPVEGERRVNIRATVHAFDRTGVEMEALTAASGAALTVYDMLKAFDKSMVIGPTQLMSKSGGRSGDYRAEPERTRGEA